MDELDLIVGAVYSQRISGEDVRLVGGRGKGLLLENSQGATLQVSRSEFFENYEPTGVHSHGLYCCMVHRIHANPHRGCVLR
jgi:hypothetical protein